LRASLLLSLILIATPGWAIDRIRMQAAQASFAGLSATQLKLDFMVRSATRSNVELRAAQLQLPAQLQAQTGAVTALQVTCSGPVIREPDFGCPAFTLTATAARLPPLSLAGSFVYRSDSGALTASGSGMKIAGVPLIFTVITEPQGMKAAVTLAGMSAAELRPVVAPWLTLPSDVTVTGRATLNLLLQESARARNAHVELQLRELAFQNGAFTWIGEKLDASLQAQVDLLPAAMPYTVELDGLHGQFLGGPVILDFDKNPLHLTARGTATPQQLLVQEFTSTQTDLAALHGSAQIGLEPFVVREARLVADRLSFPAVYASYLQLSLATTAFNQLATQGNARAEVRIVNNQPQSLDMDVSGLSIRDDRQSLRVEDVNSELHWVAAAGAAPRPSWLSWESSQGWGIVGAKTRLDFAAQARGFRLLQAARLPFFDGALVINTFVAENLGTENMSGVFDANIEPISVQPIAKAMGLPEFAGKLSGRIPGLTYKDKLLSLNGNFEADVFDGHVVASNLRVREPLSDWPKIYADITARNLDLGLITRVFEFGSITGRLDVDVTGLETFGLTPTAFDLKLGTPAGDRSRHRISQRAVESLSSMGGGGGGVAAALQSGFLKFFDEFGYERIGLACRLRNDVCRMSGTGPAPRTGFYIVKGSGTPRIDIIGNNERVAWPQFISQVVDALSNPGEIDVR
jgi:hypothetical protein